jgi:hypothetical protein
MTTSRSVRALAACAAMALAGCASKKGPVYHPFVDRWGNWPVAEDFELRVSTLGMSQLRYELWHVPSGRILAKDTGPDSKGWFFLWDDRNRLWAHAKDMGVMVWIPTEAGRLTRHRVTRGDPMLLTMPPEVAQRLPGWVRQSLALQ